MWDTAFALGFALTLARASGLFVAAPVLAGASVPVRIRMSLAFAIAVAGFIFAGMPRVEFSGTIVLISLISEALLSIIVGFTAKIAIDSAVAAGDIIGVSMGMGFSNIVDPTTAQNSSTISVLLSMTALGFGVALGLHRDAVVWFCRSVQEFPPGQMNGILDVMRFAVVEGIRACTVAVRLALPVLATVTVGHIVLGLVGRFAQQLNLNSLGFSIAIIAGIASLYIAVPIIGEMAARSAEQVFATFMGGA